jgi:peptide/nickel transport system permease protein
MTTSTPRRFKSGFDRLLEILTSETSVYIIKRLLQALLTLFLAAAVSFFIIQLAPGDYLDTLRENPKISPERIDQLRKQYGLDKSWIEQFFLWVWNIVTKGDFGTSFVCFGNEYHQPFY